MNTYKSLTFTGEILNEIKAQVNDIWEKYHDAGFVYVAVNEMIPNVCKIGMTQKRVDKRMHSLSGTSVPGLYEAVAFTWTTHRRKLEKSCHVALGRYRIYRGKEFFSCDPEQAQEMLFDLHRKQTDDLYYFSETHSLWRRLDIDEDLENGIQRGVA